MLVIASISFAQLAGPYTVGVGGTYPTLTAAMNGWKDSTITGDVTFQLTDLIYNSETYPIRCTVPALYSGGDWRLTIKPVSGNMAKFEGTDSATIFDLKGIDRLTLDSLIVINRNEDMDTAGHAVRLFNGSSFNTIKNCDLLAACKNKSSLYGGVVYFGAAEALDGPGNNDNLVENCIITSSRTDQYPVYAITIRGTAPMWTRTNNNNTIKGCKIYDFSSIGFYFSAYDSNTTITENEFYSTVAHNTQLMTGIRITATSVANTKITNNKFYNFMVTEACTTIQVIYITMARAMNPPLIANNFISLDGSITHPNIKLYGIRLLRQETTTGTYMVYYNSIYIGGTPTSGSSYGFFCKPTAIAQTKIDLRNNIIFNNRSGGTGKHYCIFDSTTSTMSFLSNYNDLYVATPGSNGQYVAHRAGVDYATLAGWQTASNRDTHSISLNPDFTSNTDLHILQSSMNVDRKAMPLANVINDIDNQPRDATQPDIGADEYTPGGFYIINATAYGPGVIVPSGTVLLDTTGFADTTFTITPDAYAHLDSLLVDGINHGSDSTSYRFVDVTANHTIAAHFSYDQYIITASAVGPGIIAPSGAVVVNGGQNATFDMTPNPNCHIDSVVVDGANQGAIPSYTFYTVIAPHTITAYFSDNPTYTITATAYGPGTIVPSGTIIVYEGDDTTFIITPNLDCQTDSVVIDGTNQGVLTSHTFTNVDANHTIDAYFSPTTPVTYTITASATSGGTITPVGDVIVNQGADTTFYIAAGPDATLDSVLVDGVSVGAVPSYTFYAVSDNHTINAIFSLVAIPGWTQKDSIPEADDIKLGKYVKDGGSLVAVGADVYCLPGNKSARFYKYTAGAWDTTLAKIPWSIKYKPGAQIDSLKINKKNIGKGAALCYDGMNTIYATKGNSTWEFFAYDISANTWTNRAFLPTAKAPKVGTSIAYLDGYVYLLAGGLKNTDIFFKYFVSGDTWITLPNPSYGVKPWKAGSAMTEFEGKLYAIKGGEKPNYFVSYDPATGWISPSDTMTTFDSVWGGSAWKYKKVYLKDGADLTGGDGVLYAMKGGGSFNFFKYTTGTGWMQLQLDTIPRLTKKSVPKTGASLTYGNGVVYLIKGNKTPEFWQYVPQEKSNIKYQKSNINTSIQTDNPRFQIPDSRFLNVNPNPFINTTAIRYNVPTSGNVSIKLYNSTGSLIQTLNSGYHDQGDYTLNLSNISSGVYFLRYQHNKSTSELKLIVQ
jgi:hypothetical protein